MAPPLDLSLIVPMYNEEENVASCVARCLEALAGLGASNELILIDDGSTDATPERIRAAARGDVRIRALSLRRRFGKGAALAAGMACARGRRIATIDADLQEDPAELPALQARLDSGYDLVGGWRRERRDAPFKVAASRIFNLLVRAVTGLRLYDINCGFKLMTREVARDLLLGGGRFRLMPLLAHWWGYRVGECAVTHRARRSGRTKFGGERFPGACIDLLTTLCLIRYHARPGHLFVTAGSAAALAGLAICIHILWIFVEHGDIQHRHPYLALGVLLLIIGVQLVATGVLGEWLAWRDRGGEPGYRVRWDSALSAPEAAAEPVRAAGRQSEA